MNVICAGGMIDSHFKTKMSCTMEEEHTVGADNF